ncbi:hypothetical protein TorRG33x02_118080, partial [Trema orientale]
KLCFHRNHVKRDIYPLSKGRAYDDEIWVPKTIPRERLLASCAALLRRDFGLAGRNSVMK